jgi:hypothetical protein
MRTANFLLFYIILSIPVLGQVKNIIYIDVSNTNEIYALQDRATELITELAKEGDYIIFISNDSEPIIIDQRGDVRLTLDNLSFIRPGNPSPDYDSFKLLKYLDKKQLDTDVKLHVFSSLYLLATNRYTSTFYQDFMVILGYDITEEKHFKNLSLYLSSVDIAQNKVDYESIDTLYPYPIINY